MFSAWGHLVFRFRWAFLIVSGALMALSVVVTTFIGPKDALTYFLPVAYVLYLVAATYEHRRAASHRFHRGDTEVLRGLASQ